MVLPHLPGIPGRVKPPLLWVGVALGALLIAWELTRSPEMVLPAATNPDVVATVDGVPIPTERYLSALALLVTREKGPAVGVSLRQRVLDDLIREELLLSRAHELDLGRRAALPRRQLLVEMIELLAGPTAEPTEAELRAWYDAHSDQLSSVDRLRVETIFFRARGNTAAAKEAARRAYEQLRAGVAFASVATSGDPPVARLPDGLLPPSALRTYLGPTATRRALELAVGEVSEPIRVAHGHRIVRVAEIQSRGRRPYDEARDVVRALMKREKRRMRIDEALEGLRASAAVVVNPAVLHATIPESALRAARPKEQR